MTTRQFHKIWYIGSLNTLGLNVVYPDIFARYERLGKDWLRRVDKVDRVAFGQLGNMCARSRGFDFASKGGKARAAFARRNKQGRFIC